MGYVEIDEKIIEEVEKVLGEKFERKGNLLKLEDIEDTLKDLLIEIDRKQEELEDEIEQREEYYKPKSKYEITGMKESDF